MIDFPVDKVQTVQEHVVNVSKVSKSQTEISNQMSEVDLSFCDALAIQCSGESSSGPADRWVPMTSTI